MPKICYVERNFSADSRQLIDTCNAIITEYAAQGFDLTLRQLYYQLVSRDVIANKVTEYKRLGSIVNDARLAGLIDWNSIVDRTRSLRSTPHWESPESIVAACSEQFAFDKWADQRYRPEVWIEKDALLGVIEPTCRALDIPWFSCRGYTSQSEMWIAAMRLQKHTVKNGHGSQIPFVIHLGDHDPSGKDMTRDIVDRLALFCGRAVGVKRIALNMDQIELYKPPPNPAKETDSRCAAYVAEFGHSSWELDALEPTVLAALISAQVRSVRDEVRWNEAVAREAEARQQLKSVSDRWDEITS